MSWIVIFILAGAGASLVRKGKIRTTHIGARRIELHTSLSAAAAFDRIAAVSGRLEVDDRDPTTRTLVLSSRRTLGTWGFLYPIVIHEEPDGARVEIGCKSKFVQIGPLVTKHHELAADELREVLDIVVPKRLPKATVHT